MVRNGFNFLHIIPLFIYIPHKLDQNVIKFIKKGTKKEQICFSCIIDPDHHNRHYFVVFRFFLGLFLSLFLSVSRSMASKLDAYRILNDHFAFRIETDYDNSIILHCTLQCMALTSGNCFYIVSFLFVFFIQFPFENGTFC